MIYLCSDFREIGTERLLNLIPQNESLRIKTLVKSPEKQLQSAAAWALLCFVTDLERATDTVRDSDGKPIIPDGNFRFSLSHCPACVAVAISDTAIGVDVEVVADSYPAEVAKRWFSPQTVKQISLSAQPNTEFYLKWTQLESFIKAGGSRADFAQADPTLFRSFVLDRVALSYYGNSPQELEFISSGQLLSRQKRN